MCLRKDTVKENTRVVLVDYLMSTGEALNASKLLVQQTRGVQVVGCFCLFTIPRVNGKKKVEDEMTKYAYLIDLDKLKIENQLINMVKAKKNEILRGANYM